MQLVRVFISSPGDVADERDRAKSVIEELRRRYVGRLDLRAVLWEDLPLEAAASFQQGIDLVLSERGADIAVFILWSRLGSPLGSLIRKADGATYRSGTEREWDLMWQAHAQSGGTRPRIVVYTRSDEMSFDERLRGLPTGDKDNLLQQKKLLEQFIAEEFHDSDGGANIRAYHSFDRPATFAQRLRIHLQEMLDPLVGDGLAEPVWDIAAQGPPFLGLDAFDFEHAPVFFGREDEIVAVRQLLREQARRGCAFVLVTGASGSGKSSLARAGVLPAVAAHEIDSVVAGWLVAILNPSGSDGDPLRALALALTGETALPALRGEPPALEQLAADLAQAPGMVCRRVLRPALETGQRRLIVLVDQLEELFTDSRIDTAAREAFVGALEALARSGCAWVVATVRSDFYGACQGLEALVRMKEGGGQFDLLLPGADALDRLIRQPAALAGLRFEERGGVSLADDILGDASTHRELLPLLEYLLHRLCAERGPDGTLTFASYEALGGVEGALARRADAVVAEVRPAEATLDALLAAVVTLSGDEQESFVRRRVPRADLERDEGTRALVATLVRERLLTSSAPAGGGPAVVTVAHEALFRVWGRAVAWLEKNREFIRLRANVAAAWSRWQAERENPTLLLPAGLPLEEGTRLLAIEAGRLDEPLHRYVARSIAHHQAQAAQRRRRRLALLAVLSVLTLLALAAAVVAWQQLRTARAAQRAEETERANAVAARDFADGQRAAADLASYNEHVQRGIADRRAVEQREMLHNASMADYSTAVHEIEAGNQWEAGVAHLARALVWDPQNRAAATWLYQTLAFEGEQNAHWLKRSLPHPAAVSSATYSPDGTRVATLSGRTVSLWDAATGAALGKPIVQDEEIRGVVFSPRGDALVTCAERFCQVWKVPSGELQSEAIRYDESKENDEDASGAVGGFLGIEYSPDGSKLLTHRGFGDIQEVVLWDALTGQPLKWSAAGVGLWHEFSPDGKRLATVSRIVGRVEATLWELGTLKAVGTLKQNEPITRLDFTSDGSVIATTDGKSARLWSAANGKPINPPWFRDTPGVVSAFCSPRGNLILLVSADARAHAESTVSLHAVGTGERIGDELSISSGVKLVRFSPDNARLLILDEKLTAHVFEFGDSLSEITFGLGSGESIDFNADGSRVLTSGDDHAQMWDAATGERLGGPFWNEGRTTDAEFSPDGMTVLTAGEDGTARFWDARQGRPTGLRLFYQSDIGPALSPDASKIVVARTGGGAAVFDLRTGRNLGELPGVGDVKVLAFSPDGARLVTAADRAVRCWDAATLKPTGASLPHRQRVGSAAFFADGKSLVTADASRVYLWDALTGKPLGEPWRPPLDKDEDVSWAAASADGSKVAVGLTNRCLLWDPRKREVLRVIPDVPSYRGEMTFSADGSLLLQAERGSGGIYRTDSGEPLAKMEGATVALSPDGTGKFVADQDRHARVIDTASQQTRGPVVRLPEDLEMACFSGDHRFLATIAAWRGEGVTRLVRVRETEELREVLAPVRYDFQPPVMEGRWPKEALLSAHGERLVVRFAGGSHDQAWDVEKLRQLPLPVPEWLPKFAQAVAGARFDADGRLVAVDPQEWRNAMAAARPGDDAWSELARWLASDPGKRTVAPGSDRTFQEMAALARDVATDGSLAFSLRYDPALPLTRLYQAAYQRREKSIADAMRRLALSKLPDDAGTWVRASRALSRQEQTAPALQAAQKAVSLAPVSISAQRVLAACLETSGQRTEAMSAYEKVLANPAAGFEDFDDAGYLAAELNNGPRAREIFKQAKAKFPDAALVWRAEGWALLNLRAPAEALEAFRRYVSTLQPGTTMPWQAVVGLAMSRWLTGDKDGAVADYMHATKLDHDLSNAETFASWNAVEKPTILQLLAETLKRYPDITRIQKNDPEEE